MNSDQRRTRAAKPHRDVGDSGGNAPRGDVTGAFENPGVSGGPAGVQQSGGLAENHQRSGTGAPMGTTPADLQKSPEELVEEWTRE
jgi:hypothetical protein